MKISEIDVGLDNREVLKNAEKYSCLAKIHVDTAEKKLSEVGICDSGDFDETNWC